MANRLLLKYKGDRCVNCGLGVDEMFRRYGTMNRMFQFNHIDPTKKHPDYDNMIRRVISSDVLDEVDKCVLLCNTCHGVVHAQDLNANLHLTVKVGTKTCTQQMKGQLIFNYQKRTALFMTDELPLVYPYRVSFGAGRPRVMFGRDLPKNRITELIENTKNGSLLVIRSWNHTELLRAKGDGEGGVNLSFDFRCLLVDSELMDPSCGVWTRNGVAITTDGRILKNGNVELFGMHRLPTPSEGSGPPVMHVSIPRLTLESTEQDADGRP